VLDLDRTNTDLHGEQEGRYFSGYYEQYCYTRFTFSPGIGRWWRLLHTCESQHLEEILRLVAKVVERLRRRFPHLRIVLRGDSGVLPRRVE